MKELAGQKVSFDRQDISSQMLFNTSKIKEMNIN